MVDHFAPVSLPGGDTLVFQAYPRTGTIVFARVRDGAMVDALSLPYPTAGLGGGRISLAPSGRIALVAMFSGQSEEGYLLFGLDGGLKKLAEQPYVFGESADYCFSTDESLFAMALPFSCIEWWLPWDDGEAKPDGSGRRRFPFGQLRVQEIATGRVSVCELRVSAADDWSPKREPYDPEMRPRFLSDTRLQVSLPWRQLEVSLPLPAALTVPVE